jgi:hypothetical protein
MKNIYEQLIQWFPVMVVNKSISLLVVLTYHLTYTSGVVIAHWSFVASAVSIGNAT